MELPPILMTSNSRVACMFNSEMIAPISTVTGSALMLQRAVEAMTDSAATKGPCVSESHCSRQVSRDSLSAMRA